MGATPAEPATAAAGRAARPARAPLQVARLALGSLLALLVLAALAYELAAARVPQHRAALEELIRHETGLEVRFSELTLRWGWYGPEAVFHGVELDEPRGGVLLRAPELIVGLDLWRMARSGRFEAGRITLHDPDIDLAVPIARASPVAHASAVVPEAGARLLAHWRGGQLDIEGGTLRAVLAEGSEALALGIRQARLRRAAGGWSADALLRLPESLGASAHLTLQIHGDPTSRDGSGGSLSLEARHLEFAGWRRLARQLDAASYLPQTGSGTLEVSAEFAHGKMLRASGRIHAQELAWASTGTSQSVVSLPRLRGEWLLVQHGSQWHVSVNALELAAGSAAQATPATLAADVGAGGAWVRGRAQHAPLGALALLAHWFAPELPLGAVSLDGEARELTFDWSAGRAVGARLATAGVLEDLTLRSASGALVLTGLSGRFSGSDTTLAADLQAQAAYLTTAEETTEGLGQLAMSAHLIATAGGGWQLSTDDLRVRRAGLNLDASGTIASASPAARPLINTRLAFTDTDVALVASLLGTRALGALGTVAAQLTQGRIENAAFVWRGPLDDRPAWSVPAAQFSGTAELRNASLAPGQEWPEVSGIDARLEWRGPHLHAVVDRAQSAGFRVSGASADWDARLGYAAHFAARIEGSAQDALAWLREHPRAAVLAPGIADIDLRGDTLLDVEVSAPSRVRVAAVLESGELRPVAGLPPITALHGTLAFASGQLQHSTLTGEWLGGPVSLGVGSHSEHGTTVLAISGHGAMGARHAVQAAGGNAEQVALGGSAEWSALLTILPGSDAQQTRWQLHADSSLVGVVSRLPEPLAKSAATALPLRLDLQAAGAAGQLHVGLGERLAAVAALTRHGETWRIERGAVRLAGGAPALPAEAVMVLEGRVGRLDLPAYLALWRQAGADAALPELRARLIAGQLSAGARSYPDVSLTAQSLHGAAALQLQSAELAGSARWSERIDDGHPAVVHLASLNIAQPADTALGAELASVLAPSAQLQIDDLKWRGRTLGSFTASLSAHADVLEASELRLSGVSGETRASARCLNAACTVKFTLESADAAATLAAFGLRPEISATHASLEGELHWLPEAIAPLATLDGHLHMQLQEGTARATSAAGNAPFALLTVPALLAGMSPEAADESQPELRFARLTADYELRDGEAATTNLHFDGDAEILVRGRVSLTADAYDAQAWILRGEDRLPDPVRRLGPTPRMAAVWLSLRELFAGTAADRTRTALRLRGSWDDPIVTPAE